MPFKIPSEYRSRRGQDLPPNNNEPRPMPWKIIFLTVGLVFFTGLLALLQNFSAYFAGSIVGKPSYILSGYNCPEAGYKFKVSPVPDLFSYQEGDADYNRREMVRINKKNHGLTSWYSYDKGFDE